MHKLLDVSRRLTDVAASGDVDRAVVRDAIDLVGADGSALVRRHGDELVVAAESTPGLLIPEYLSDGVFRQVSDTGQPLLQVSATERAIRNLPVALVAVPLVNGGRVEAVLLVVRRHSEPFVGAERDVLVSMAPVAAAAMQTAKQARAAVEQSLVDCLTGAGNRRRFDEELDHALADRSPTCLCIVDLDHFKAVNDSHGHPAGDALLTGVAAVMRENVRPGDSVYRIGGEEFALLFRHTSLAEGVEVAERVRGAIAAEPFAISAQKRLTATASLGLAAAGAGESGAELLSRADLALYAAKEAGRNQVNAGRAGEAPVPVHP